MTETIQQVEDEVREAVKYGDDLYQQVRAFTLEALTEHELDMENIKSVVQAVSNGINASITSQYAPANTAFKQSVEALDDAPVKTAQVSKLTIEEATSRVSVASRHDLNRATEDLKNPEEMFLETVEKVALESNDIAFDIVEGFISHARQSGTSVGKQTNTAMENLNDLRHIRQGVIVTDTAAKTSTIAPIASGILSAIAESLHTDKHNS